MLKTNQSFTCLAGKRVSKSAQILAVLGDLDELISVLGVVKAFSSKKGLKEKVANLQESLISLGGWLSGSKSKLPLEKETTRLEKETSRLKTPLKKFIRPGANQVSAFLHLARVITRRLERRVVGLEKASFRPVVVYLNRLSSFLFWLAVKEEKVKS